MSGCVAGLALMAIGPKVADPPDFWGIAVVVGVVSTCVSLPCGCALGLLSVKLAGLFGAVLGPKEQ